MAAFTKKTKKNTIYFTSEELCNISTSFGSSFTGSKFDSDSRHVRDGNKRGENYEIVKLGHHSNGMEWEEKSNISSL